MCLSALSSRPSRLPLFRQHVGWKVVELTANGNFISQFQDKVYKPGNWYKTKRVRSILTTRGSDRFNDGKCKWDEAEQYVPGFHVYLRKPHVYGEHFVARRLEWFGCMHTGYEDGKPIVIAAQIRFDVPAGD